MPWLQSKEEFLHNFFFSLAPIQVTQRTLTTFQGPNAHQHHSKLSAQLLQLLLLLSSSSSAVSFPMPLGFSLSTNVRDITHHHKKLFGCVWQMITYSVFRD
jgi:hypothetical protein